MPLFIAEDSRPHLKPTTDSGHLSLHQEAWQKKETIVSPPPSVSAGTALNQSLEHLSSIGASYGAVHLHNKTEQERLRYSENLPRAGLSQASTEEFISARQQFAMELERRRQHVFAEIEAWRQANPGLVREVKLRTTDPHSPTILAPALNREIPPALSASLERFQNLDSISKELASLKPDNRQIKTFSGNHWVEQEGLGNSARRLELAINQINLEKTSGLKALADASSKQMRSAALTAGGAFGTNYLIDQTIFKRSSPTALTYVTDIAAPLILLSQHSSWIKAGVIVGGHTLAKIIEPAPSIVKSLKKPENSRAEGPKMQA